MNNYNLDNFEPAAKIVVIGVGGGGNNAVNRMIDEEIQNVDFYVANTDKQALSTSKSNNRLILGEDLTNGLGAGGIPEIGEKAAEASSDEIREIVKDANMVFIAAGMGGGTGTGASPVIAKIAKDCGALVVAIVTRPFNFEGKKRNINSIEGLNKLKANVDSIIVINNDKLLMTAGNSPMNEAFSEADGVLARCVKTVVDIILLPGLINCDFSDVNNTLKDSGVALIGFGLGRGPNKSKDAATSSINCPLIETSICGARRAIASITCGPNVSLMEAQNTVQYLREVAGGNIDIKFGVTFNNQLDDAILVSVIAADFENEIDFSQTSNYEPSSFEPNTSTSQVTEENTSSEDADSSEDEDILPSFLKD